MNINCIFADATYKVFQQKRFGIRACNMGVDMFLAHDLLKFHKRLEDANKCNVIIDSEITLSKIHERINTL